MRSTEHSSASYQVAVRSLCEFVCKTGDLDTRFTPSPTSLQGIAGHIRVREKRHSAYQSEISLEGQYQTLRVVGRADGFDPTSNQLEEIKTHKGASDVYTMPANQRALHWSQAKIYGWLMCQKQSLDEIKLALVYFDIDSEEETLMSERYDADVLRQFFESTCAAYLDWAQRQAAYIDSRNSFCKTLSFPFGELTGGQRVFAEAVYRAQIGSRCVIAQAPTGVGKTIGSLFPSMKALGNKTLDKVFYLTAKTPGRALALESVAQINAQVVGTENEIRVLELVAKDKACVHPDKQCNGESCPLAKGFYDRLPMGREAACQSPGAWTQAYVAARAIEHSVCPYYLSQELVRWADVIVGDYNYYFDVSAMLFSFSQQEQWRVGVLVDEAHNLLERARKMYSATLAEKALDDVNRGVAQQLLPKAVQKDFQKLQRAWRKHFKEQTVPYSAIDSAEAMSAKLVLAIEATSNSLGTWLADPATLDLGLDPSDIKPVQTLFFDMLHFQKIAELQDEYFFLESQKPAKGEQTITLRNVIPAKVIAQRFKAAASVTLFSATLAPMLAYRQALGLPENTVEVDIDSPFSSDQLAVTVHRSISTRFKDRSASLNQLAKVMAEQFTEKPGNYLAFFSSFDYLSQALDAFSVAHPGIAVFQQSRSMAEAERTAFLESFVDGGQGIGFVVLGGVFSEGVDLPGDRLIGAFIATLGMPQINQLNDEMKQRLDKLLGAGYEHVYLYPGIQKVVQAAGRVIRGKTDTGCVHLLDDRFGGDQVRRLLPAWWQITVTGT
jgi:DNA excision repair protein ERCC-2